MRSPLLHRSSQVGVSFALVVSCTRPFLVLLCTPVPCMKLYRSYTKTAKRKQRARASAPGHSNPLPSSLLDTYYQNKRIDLQCQPGQGPARFLPTGGAPGLVLSTENRLSPMSGFAVLSQTTKPIQLGIFSFVLIRCCLSIWCVYVVRSNHIWAFTSYIWRTRTFLSLFPLSWLRQVHQQ